MKKLKRSFSLTIIGGLAGTCLASTQGLAQLPDISPIQFTPPTLNDRGRPYSGRRQGAASRGSCQLPEANTGLTALVPNTQVAVDPTPESTNNSYLSTYESVLSLTTAAFPSFWFYVPYAAENIKELEFVLQDDDGNNVYQRAFTDHYGNPGIVEVVLPQTLSPLAIDTTYEWFFIAHCESGATALSPGVGGWIRRVQVASTLQTQLNNASPVERAALYAQNGIWQNAITLLGHLYRTSPDSAMLSENWRSLLTSIDLGPISDYPLLEGVSKEPSDAVISDGEQP